jgi:hypothetical protein
MLLLFAGSGLTSDKSGQQISWQVISGGGADGSSANFKPQGTVSQTAVGTGSSDSHGLSHGFRQEFGECDCLPGDANVDVEINVADAVYLINYVFKGGSPPVKDCYP